MAVSRIGFGSGSPIASQLLSSSLTGVGYAFLVDRSAAGFPAGAGFPVAGLLPPSSGTSHMTPHSGQRSFALVCPSGTFTLPPQPLQIRVAVMLLSAGWSERRP